MTTRTPQTVYYTYTAKVDVGSAYVNLPVTNIVASMDRDRVPYCEATISTDWIDDTTLAALDPRKSTRPKVVWQILQWSDVAGVRTEISRLPNDSFGATEAEMFVRTVERDAINRTATIQLGGGETMLQDKKRDAGTQVDTGATLVSELVQWSLTDVFGFYDLTYGPPSSTTAIPAGERRKMNPSESHIDLMKPELDAIDCRLIDRWRQEFEIILRTQVTNTVKLATYNSAPDDADPIIYGFTETYSRDGDWYDGVLVKYDQTATGGGVSWQASGGGANTRGVTYTRNRAAPAGNSADKIKTRTLTRGYDIDIVARARFDIEAYDTLQVFTPGASVTTVRIRSIEWNTETSEMHIRGQAGEPEATQQPTIQEVAP